MKNGIKCIHCQEEILPGDPVMPFNNCETAMHLNCELRGIIGSVAHLEHRCSCFVPGSEEGDPPGMTRREAADAAVKLWRKQDQTRSEGIRNGHE